MLFTLPKIFKVNERHDSMSKRSGSEKVRGRKARGLQRRKEAASARHFYLS